MAGSHEETSRLDAEATPFSLPAPMLQVIAATDDDERGRQQAVGTPSTPPTRQPAPDTSRFSSKGDRHGPQRSHSALSFRLPLSLHARHGSRSRSRSANASPECKERRKLSRWTKTSSNSNSSSTIHSPEIQAMIKGKVVPDLDAVNKALNAVNGSSDSNDGERTLCVKQLSALAADLGLAQRDGQKLLNEAMRARSAGKDEICRAKCVQIVRSAYADTETKIYANNILATQASVGHADHFLDRSMSLLEKSHLGEGQKERMVACIAILRESEKTRAGKATTRKDDVAANKFSEQWLHHG